MKKLGRACDPRALIRIGATAVNAAESAENCAYEPDDLDLSGLAAAEAAASVIAKQVKTKSEAQRRIIALIPGGDANNYIIKEMNLLMQSVALVDKQARGVALTIDEQTMLADYRNMKAGIDAIRAASNRIEQDIAASQDPAAYDVPGSALWP